MKLESTIIKILKPREMDVMHRFKLWVFHFDLLANKERRQRRCVKRNPVIEAVNNGRDNVVV